MIMRAEYDFSDARKNPYAKILKRQITINIDNNTIDYFKAHKGEFLYGYSKMKKDFTRKGV